MRPVAVSDQNVEGLLVVIVWAVMCGVRQLQSSRQRAIVVLYWQMTGMSSRAAIRVFTSAQHKQWVTEHDATRAEADTRSDKLAIVSCEQRKLGHSDP